MTRCEDNNLREGGAHQPLIIHKLKVERVSSFKFLLTWTLNSTQLVKKAEQWLYFLRRLSPKIFSNFYSCIVERILTGCITVWYGSITAIDCKPLPRLVETAERIT